MSGVYGGDEVGALVFDLGHNTMRLGYAGEDCPKAEISSGIGVLEAQRSEEKAGGPQAKIAKTQPECKYYIDKNALSVPREGVEVKSFLKNGMIDDWDLLESVLNYVFKQHLMCDPQLHPILMSEPPWNEKSAREQLCELIFEKYSVPAFYLCKNAVLASFANGRATGLVLDSGATHTSAIPVYDGYCLTNSVVRLPLGGDVITKRCLDYITSESKVDVTPSYKICSKQPVNDRDKPKFTVKPNLPKVTESYHNHMVRELIQDFQATVLQVSDGPYNPDVADKIPAFNYEFPTGYHQDFVSERMAIPEILFNPSFNLDGLLGSGDGQEAPYGPMSISQAVTGAVSRCDIDIRQALYNGVMVTGGNSLLQGFCERLQADIQMYSPANVKLKLISPASSSERRFGAWIGGSILASLGSFQQMWISRQDYDEMGRGLVDKKCP